MFQPSRTTNTISMKHRRTNQVSTIASGTTGPSCRRVRRQRVSPKPRRRRRTVRYFSTDQIQEQKTEHEIHARRADQREDHRSRAHDLAESSFSAEQSVNQPRLPSQLAGQPSRGVGDEWKRKREHEDPQETMTRVEPAANLLKR